MAYKHLVKLSAHLSKEGFAINEYLIRISKEGDRTIKGFQLDKQGEPFTATVVKKDIIGKINSDNIVSSLESIRLSVICREKDKDVVHAELKKRVIYEVNEYVKQVKVLLNSAKLGGLCK